MAPPSPAGMGGPVWVRCTPHALMVLAQEVEAQDDTDAVSGDICTVTSGGELNAEHVLLEPEVHISDLRHLHGERRRFDHFRHRYHPRDGDCGRQEPARAREDRRGRGVVCRGDHHKPVQRSGGEEPLEGARSDTRQRRCGGARELGERITPCGGQLHLLASSVKRYLAKLSLTAWMSMVGGTQSAVFAAFVQRNLDDWLIGFGLKFWCIVYTGIACNGLTVVIQLWCNKKKGPVFVTMFNPLLTVMVTALAYFIFGENLHVGSVIGGTLVILGLYMLLWGKDRDQQEHKVSNELDSELDCEKQATVLRDVSAARDDNAPKTMK